MIYTVEVDVATCRPPKVDSTVTVFVSADSENEATLTAIHMACVRNAVVMPVGSRIINVQR